MIGDLITAFVADHRAPLRGAFCSFHWAIPVLAAIAADFEGGGVTGFAEMEQR